MTRDVDQQQAPHVRLLEGALERDREPAIDHERAQHLGRILATDDIRRQWLFVRPGHGLTDTKRLWRRRPPRPRWAMRAFPNSPHRASARPCPTPARPAHPDSRRRAP